MAFFSVSARSPAVQMSPGSGLPRLACLHRPRPAWFAARRGLSTRKRAPRSVHPARNPWSAALLYDAPNRAQPPGRAPATRSKRADPAVRPAVFFRVTRWVIDAEARRQRLSFKGGEQNTSSDIVAETFDAAGAYLMGRRMADGGEIP